MQETNLGVEAKTAPPVYPTTRPMSYLTMCAARQWPIHHNHLEYQQSTWWEVSQRPIIQYSVLERVKIGRLLGIIYTTVQNIYMWYGCGLSYQRSLACDRHWVDKLGGHCQDVWHQRDTL